MSYRKTALILFFAVILAGCARAPVTKPPRVETLPPKAEGGLYHKVVKGETLWRISKNYGVELDSIIEANGLSRAEKIRTGQVIFIPKGTAAPSTKPAPAYSREDFIWPIKGRVVTSFGERKNAVPSKGIDIQAREGMLVLASRSGRVIFCEDKVKGFGKTVIIDHGDGIQTVYSHNSEILVKVGQDVKQSEAIAKVGSTGRAGTPYLHFEIRKRHKPQNPIYYLS